MKEALKIWWLASREIKLRTLALLLGGAVLGAVGFLPNPREAAQAGDIALYFSLLFAVYLAWAIWAFSLVVQALRNDIRREEELTKGVEPWKTKEL